MANKMGREDYEAELDKLHLEVGRSVDEWSRVEQWLHDIFALSVAAGGGFSPAISASFWAVESFEAKLKFVSEVIFNTNAGMGDSLEIAKDWQSLRNKLSKINKLRNKLAHGGAVSPKAVNGTTPEALPIWVPFYEKIGYQLFKMTPPEARHPKSKKFEELEVDDIRHIRGEFVKSQNLLHNFYHKHLAPAATSK